MAWTRAVEDAAPSFHRHGVVGYRVYRGQYFTVSTSAPGCVVAVRREFDGPDLRRARAWVDAMFAATGDAAPLPGMIAAHMHVSVDGSRVASPPQSSMRHPGRKQPLRNLATGYRGPAGP